MQKQLDVYEAIAWSEDTIECEQIASVVLELSATQAFQEDLTRELAQRLGVNVQTTGVHSGVKVESIATL